MFSTLILTPRTNPLTGHGNYSSKNCILREKKTTSIKSPDNFDMLNENLRNIEMEQNHCVTKQQALNNKTEI